MKISSGSYKGLELKTPGGATHPMGSRERIALFNMLLKYMDFHDGDISVLDAYAGSGVLGLEAMSHGAFDVTFVEKTRVGIRVIRENCERAPVPASQFYYYRGTVDDFCEKAVEHTLFDMPFLEQFTGDEMHSQFELILADPPYDKFNPKSIEHLGECLFEEGILVLSHPGIAPRIDGIHLEQSRKYAGATISIYTKE